MNKSEKILPFIYMLLCALPTAFGFGAISAIALCGVLALSLSLSFNPSIKAFWNIIPYAAFCFPKSHIDYTEDTDEVS